MPRLFGTSGIRGTTNTEITAELCLKISQAYGTKLFKLKKRRCKVCVAYDTRFGAPTLARAAAAGLSASGHDVIDFGILPTGAFSMNITLLKADGGVLITGSHMPYDRIGVILMLDDGAYAPFDVTDEVEKIYFEGSFLQVKPDEIGTISEGSNPFDVYVNELIRKVDREAIARRGFRVLLDPGNGAAAVVARQVFEKLGCEVVSINATYQHIPNRPSEPRDNTVQEAKNIVKVLKLDMGLCLDVDADRSLFITQKGEALSEDTVGAIFARHELKGGDLCVVPVNSSGLIEYVCTRIGARLEYCRIGQPETLKAVKQLGAAYSYEESGKYYFARHFLWSDGVYSGAKMLEVMAKEKRPLADLAAVFPRFHQVKHTVHINDAKKQTIMEAVFDLMQKQSKPEEIKDVVLDGYKRVFPDNSWLLIRKSGTEPLIRVYSDAPTLERAKELVEEGTKVLQEAIRLVG